MSRITPFIILAIALQVTFAAVTTRRLEVKNECPFEVWVAAFGTEGVNRGVFPIMWGDNGNGYLAPGASNTIVIPAPNWYSARVWARTDCDFSRQGVPKCRTGDCNGRENCQSPAGANTGLSPLTLAEYTLAESDFYDISCVDGVSIPVITYPLGNAKKVAAVDYEYENCGTAGSCFLDSPDWVQAYHRECPKHNQIFGNCINNECQGGAKCHGSSGICGEGNDTSKITGCASDNYLSSLPEGARGSPQPNWPLNEDFPKYGCPVPYTTGTCPANYHLPVGVSPFKDWPEWFARRCPVSAYGFSYDDATSTYQCQTSEGDGAYAIVFCPKPNNSSSS